MPLCLYLWRTRTVSPFEIAGFVIPAIIVTLPLIQHFVHRPDAFVGRSQAVSVFRPEYVRQLLGPDAALPFALPALLIEQLRRVLSIFVQYGDAGGFYYANVPDSDGGEVAGIAGEGTIAVDAAGTHRFTHDYQLD